MRTVRHGLLALATAFSIATSQAQTADDVVNKHVDAIGGKDAWKKVTSTKMEGSLNVQGTDVSVTITKLHNKGMRQDIAVMGMTGYIIITPTEGTTYMPFQGQTEQVKMSADDLKQAQDQLDAQGPLIDYKEKGHSVELAGKETLDGVECFKLTVTLKNGKKETRYIDTKNYYQVRSISTAKVNGQEVEQTVSFSNFQKLPEGIVVPMTITQQFGDVTVNKMEVNKAVDESIFKAQ
jgi:hypothetical protein